MRTRSLGMAAVLVLACGMLAQAGPLQLKEVPAGAKWVANVNADAARSSTVVKKLYDECISGGKAAACVDKITRAWGMDPRKDLHSLTLYGTKFVPGQGVMIVNAKLDKALLLKKAEKAPDHKTIKYRNYELHTWMEKKHGHEHVAAGAFYKPDVLVLASDVGMLKTALDVLDGHGANLQGAKSPLAAAVPTGTIFLLRATGIDKSKAAAHKPLCSEVADFSYAEGEHGGHWFGHLGVTAKSGDVAQHVETSLSGLQAFLWLHLHATPKLQKLIDQVKISRKDKVVNAEFQAPVQRVADAMPDLCKLIKKHIQKHMAMHHAMMEHHWMTGHHGMMDHKCCHTKHQPKKCEAKKPNAKKKSTGKKKAESKSVGGSAAAKS